MVDFHCIHSKLSVGTRKSTRLNFYMIPRSELQKLREYIKQINCMTYPSLQVGCCWLWIALCPLFCWLPAILCWSLFTICWLLIITVDQSAFNAAFSSLLGTVHCPSLIAVSITPLITVFIKSLTLQIFLLPAIRRTKRVSKRTHENYDTKPYTTCAPTVHSRP